MVKSGTIITREAELSESTDINIALISTGKLHRCDVGNGSDVIRGTSAWFSVEGLTKSA